MTRTRLFAATLAGLGLAAGTTVLARADAGGASPLLINESSSLARGVYRRLPVAEPGRGAIVAVDPPAEVRAYLSGLGAPPDLPLLKRVVAVGGDRVCREGARVTGPGFAVRALAADRRGVGLPEWTGCRRLGRSEVFLLGDGVASFDSRYFGPVGLDRIRGVYTEVWTW
jgi:type IV secretory pathway protease TraF